MGEHEPLPAVDTPKVTILSDFPIRTGRTIQGNKPDIVIKHKQNKTCQLIDMGVPSDRNISAKEFEKLRKYEDLEIEIVEIRKMKTKIIPVIVVAPGIIKKETQKNANEIPGNTDYFTPKLFLCKFYTNIFTQLYTIFFICNIYTIQIYCKSSYQNYTRLERNIH